jgi:Bardet-Biedl syndrome 1 protein
MYTCFLKFLQGKKLWSVAMPADITTLQMMDHKQKGFKAILVALSNSEVHTFREKYLCNVMKTPDVVTGMRFGKFGREDASLIMTTKGWCCMQCLDIDVLIIKVFS